MQSKADLEDAFNKILMGNFRERKAGMEKYWAPKAQFWHFTFKAETREDAWGVYQLWKCNNGPEGIDIDYLHVVYDRDGDAAILDVLETCNVWWNPQYWLTGVGPFARLHVILDLEDGPHGKVIKYQHDHFLLMESILYYNLPPAIGKFAKAHVLPLFGKALAAAGSSRKLQDQTAGKYAAVPAACLRNPKEDIPKAVTCAHKGTAAERHHMINSCYAEDATFYHSLYTVQGRDKIFGVLNFWVQLNRMTEFEVRHVVPGKDFIVVDGRYLFKPIYWPPFLPDLVLFVHAILTTVDNPNGGKLITKHESHILGFEPLMIHNLGPVSWLYAHLVRPFMGKLFGVIGRTLYVLLDLLDQQGKKGKHANGPKAQ